MTAVQSRLEELKRTQWQTFARPAIIVLAIAFALYFGFRPSNMVLYLVGGLIAFGFLQRNLELDLVILLIAALFVPFALDTGTGTRLIAPLLLTPILMLIWFLDMLHQRDIRLIPTSANLPAIGLVISATLSLLGGNVTWDYDAGRAPLAAQLGGWAEYLLSVGLFLMVAGCVKREHWLKLLIAIVLVTGIPVVFSRFSAEFGAIVDTVIQPSASGGMLWVWIVALSGGLALYHRKLPSSLRVVLMTFALITIAAGYFWLRVWVSGWLPPLVALTVLLMLRDKRLGLALAVVGVIFIANTPDLFSSLVTLKSYSIDTRTVAWQIILEHIVPVSPIIGTGPANYYFYTPLYSILGYNVSFNSHNQYVDLLTQLGIVGLGMYLWLMLALAKTAWDLLRRLEDGFSKAYVYAYMATGLFRLFITSGWKVLDPVCCPGCSWAAWWQSII